MTALFCDVVGSTSIAETMDPEDWSEVINQAIAVMAESVERYGGTVTQFAGDGILALFGAPVAHEDDPYRAIQAGVSIVEAVRSGDDNGIRVRVGITTGLVVAGDIDAGDLNVYSALGDTLNVAARLQELAEPGTVVISEQTRALVSNDVEVKAIGPADLKGRTESVEVYEIVSVRGSDERHRGISGLASPMVGRDEELERLSELVTAAAAGTGRVVAILGEPGVGKTRLTEEFGARVADHETALWAVGRCVPYDNELPYHLIASLMRSLAGVTASDDPQLITKSITELADAAGEPEATGPLLKLVGVSDTDDDAEDTPEELQAEYADAVHAVVAGLGVEHRPVVLVCEDAHWADRSSTELMSGLLDRAPSTPVLLVVVMRPNRRSEGWTLLAEARRQLGESLVEIPLAPLEDGDSRRMVEHLLAIESLPSRLRNMVLEKAEGNPFFLEEVVRMLIDSGVVVERGDRWVATADIGHLDVPATVHGLLAARIDLLPPEVRRAGRVAAVIGRQFPASLLAAVHPVGDRAGTTLHPHIAALEGHGMVALASTRPTVEFAFKHALIHDVMYEGLLKRERRELHRAVAEAIEEMYAERLEDQAPALARHYLVAGDSERALRYLLSAGRAALARGARAESHRFYSHAVDLTDGDSDPGRRIDAVLGQAGSGATFIPVPESIALLEGCLPIAEELDDPDRLAALYVQLLGVRNMQGESYATHPYREQLDAAYALVPRLEDPGTRALLQGMMGLAHRSADEYAESIEPLTASVAELEDAGRLSEASYHASMLADSHAMLGSFAEAEAVIAEARRLGLESGDPNSVADADLIRGGIAAEQGDLEEALIHTREGLEAAEAIGNTFCTLAGNFLVADQQLRMGDPAEAISHLERSTGLAEYCSAGGYEVLGQAWLAAAKARLGDFEPAAFDEPLAKAIAAGSRSAEAQIRFHRAVTIAGSGRPEDSFDDFERSLSLFSSFEGLPSLARVSHAYARALEAAGREDEAATRLRNAEELFDRLGMKPERTHAG